MKNKENISIDTELLKRFISYLCDKEACEDWEVNEGGCDTCPLESLQNFRAWTKRDEWLSS